MRIVQSDRGASGTPTRQVPSIPIVRPVREGDQDALLELVRKFHEKVHPPYNQMATLAGMTRPGGWLWVAERDGVLVGYLWLTAKGPREAYLEQIYADTEVVEGFERVIIPLLRHHGFTIIETTVLREGWKRMLQRWGFTPTGVLMERVIETEGLHHTPVLQEVSIDDRVEEGRD